MSLTIFGGRGFVGKNYTEEYYHHAIGNIVSINDRSDYHVYSPDVLYFISTVDNYNVFTNVHLDIDTNLSTLMTVLENWRTRQLATGERGVFNFVSSWSVYGDQTTLPVSETAACDPKGFYIITKRCAEQLLISYCETFNLKYRILRLANIVGPGDEKTSDKKNTLQNAFNKLKRNEDVKLFGNGMFFRDFMHVKDCVRALETVMVKGEYNTTYNVGNGSLPGHLMFYVSILNHAREYLESTGEVVFTEPTEFQAKTPVSSFYMDVTKLHCLGFVPEYTGWKLYDSLLMEK